MNPDDPRHGTDPGYQAHRRAGEHACDDCRRARRESRAKRRESADVRRREYEQAMARNRAYSRLAQMHRATFDALYAEELG